MHIFAIKRLVTLWTSLVEAELALFFLDCHNRVEVMYKENATFGSIIDNLQLLHPLAPDNVMFIAVQSDMILLQDICFNLHDIKELFSVKRSKV